MKERLRGAVSALSRTAAFRAAVDTLDRLLPAHPGALVVLTYHRVDRPDHRPWLYPGLISATPDEFRRQLEWVGSRLRPVSMDAVLEARRTGRPLPARAVLITFDDAYADIQEHAWPTLVRLGIPATLFVPTAAVADDWPGFWWDRVHEAVLDAAAGAGGELETAAGRLPVATAAERATTMRRLLTSMKSMDHDRAMAEVDRLTAGTRGAADRPQRSTLTWGQVRDLARDGLRMAPHTHSHPLLPRITSERVRSELTTARAELRANVPDSLETVLAYPSGAHDDRTVEVVRDLGFELAFTTVRGVDVFPTDHPLRIRRINVGGRTNAPLIHAQLVAAAATHGVRRLARRRPRGARWSA